MRRELSFRAGRVCRSPDCSGSLGESPEDVEQDLNYMKAMRWFSDSTIGISVGVAENSVPKVGGSIYRQYRFPETSCGEGRGKRAYPAACWSSYSRTHLRGPGLSGARESRLKRTTTGRPGAWRRWRRYGRDDRESYFGLESDFEIRYVSASDFADIDVCLTSKLQGVDPECFCTVSHLPQFRHTASRSTRECRALKFHSLRMHAAPGRTRFTCAILEMRSHSGYSSRIETWN